MHIHRWGLRGNFSECLHLERMQLECTGLANQRRPLEIHGKGMVIQAHSEAETTVNLDRQCFPHQDLWETQAVLCSSSYALIWLP